MTKITPKAFISHPSEDKVRFVIPFSSALRAKGIDAWVDRWEIRPGDSLVQKIFDEGLGRADAALIVLSRASVGKPWVREELDSAFVSRVSGRLRLIPIIIDDCDVPAPLKHLLHVRVPNVNAFEPQVNEIAQTLFLVDIKPPLGEAPNYIRRRAPFAIQGLQPHDVQTLLALGQLHLTYGRGPVDRSALESVVGKEGISADVLLESLEVLEGEGFVKGMHALDGKFFMVEWTRYGAGIALETLVPDFEKVRARIATFVANSGQCDSSDIERALDVPSAVAEHVLKELESRGMIRTAAHMQGIMVYEVSPRLRRALRDSGD